MTENHRVQEAASPLVYGPHLGRYQTVGVDCHVYLARTRIGERAALVVRFAEGRSIEVVAFEEARQYEIFRREGFLRDISRALAARVLSREEMRTIVGDAD
jgi:hypothetical protein